MKNLLTLFAVATALGSATVSAADAGAGKEKAVICAGCHGVDGKAFNPEWPNLAGQNDKYIIAQLKAFKDGSRKNPMMSPMAQGLSDSDMENIAAYFSSLK